MEGDKETILNVTAQPQYWIVSHSVVTTLTIDHSTHQLGL